MPRLKIVTEPIQADPSPQPAVSGVTEPAPVCNTPSAGAATAAADRPSKRNAKSVGRPPKKGARSVKPAPRPARPDIDIRWLPVDQLVPNTWNPNMFTAEQRAEIREEVRRAGRPPKPALVRRLKDGRYQIVDGEHGWEAARDDGLAQVLCEVATLNDFDAKRETYVRNQHGTLDRLRTGRLLQELVEEERKAMGGTPVSQRQFAKKLNIDEATLRNYLLYARAAEVRQAYAPETAAETITNLSIEKVRKYIELPANRRNEWVDNGAQTDQAAAILAEVSGESRRSKRRTSVEEQPTTPPAATVKCTAADASVVGDEDPEVGGVADASARQPGITPTAAEAQPVPPLTPAEQHAVDGVLRLYENGRPLVRQKLLAGLAAFPDAVAFFRRMIQAGG